jgi:uncharacterized small protein (DUF1192 family)
MAAKPAAPVVEDQLIEDVLAALVVEVVDLDERDAILERSLARFEAHDVCEQ